MQSIVQPEIKIAITCQRVTAEWKSKPHFLSLAFRIALLLMMLYCSGWWEQSDLFSQPIPNWDLWYIYIYISFKDLWSTVYNLCAPLQRLPLGSSQHFFQCFWALIPVNLLWQVDGFTYSLCLCFLYKQNFSNKRWWEDTDDVDDGDIK